jgi:NADPH-dependent 2,4-dienoyl-CoA reductase/sulfur reductase-like enzyme/Pyruvate/2-oxoacid:ferredoxin oxidoreductase delta subunit
MSNKGRITDHPVLDIPATRPQATFSFDDQEMTGIAGEMLSAALFANGIRRFSEHPGDGAPQGLFCANGQCAQCSVLVDGVARKACITALRTGMDVRTIIGLPALTADNAPARHSVLREVSTDVLVIGGGPSGLSAAAELAEAGLDVILADDKVRLGGKLVLQTHKFFGSEQDCHAGTRGLDIAGILENRLRALAGVRMLANSPVVGVYKDHRAGIYEDHQHYLLVRFTALLVATGARERSILFPGNDLPGVYGAGAFQTLVNRDLVKAAAKVFVIGSGNVGLIAAYHALQAGITVVGICEILPQITGYKVHADKIIRLGIPVFLESTVVAVHGDGQVRRISIATVDEKRQVKPETVRSYAVDTVLVATGLTPCDEFYRQAKAFGIPVVKAGDADEIAEASSAIFSGRIAARSLARQLGCAVSIDPAWLDKRDVLKSRPGATLPRVPVVASPDWMPVFFCDQEIPCNPCSTVCPTGSIKLESRLGTIMDLPYFKGRCQGCAACVASCPGLAMSLVRRIDADWTEVVLPFEFKPVWDKGTSVPVTDQAGRLLEHAELLRKRYMRRYRTWLLTLKVSSAKAGRAIGIRLQPETATQAEPTPVQLAADPGAALVCRCERVDAATITAFIKDHAVRDANQLKTIRVGMGACGSKTCSALLPQLFRTAGVDPEQVTEATLRPLLLEVPIGDLVNEAPPADTGS